VIDLQVGWDEDPAMSADDPGSDAPREGSRVTASRTRNDDGSIRAPSGGASTASSNPWIWASALLALVAVGLLIWALTLRSDRDSAGQELVSAQQQLAAVQDDLDSANQDLDSQEQELASVSRELVDLRDETDGAADDALVKIESLYDRFSGELDAKREDLASLQADVEAARQAADEADEAAAAAGREVENATGETERALAEADEARAEVEAAESRAGLATDCAKAFIAAFGGLFEADDGGEEPATVRGELASIVDDCEAQLTG
jgi:uncharacterized membrane-anchored protein YhcB (DUF1043 family)